MQATGDLFTFFNLICDKTEIQNKYLVNQLKKAQPPHPPKNIYV